MGEYAEKLRVVVDGRLDDLPEVAPVFGTRAWLAATSKALPFPLRILRVYKGEALAAYLPLQTLSRGFLSKAFAPVLTFYGGPYFVGERRKYFNEELKQRYEIQREMLAWLEARHHYCLLLPDEFDARVALERGWTCTPRYTLLNRLKSADSLEFNRACSKSIRKAERLGLRVAEGADGDDGAFEAAFARTFERKGLRMAWKPRWAADLRAALAGSGLLENLSVYTPEGKAIAFASVALDAHKRTAILWYSCSLAEADQTGAMHFLYYSLLLRYRERFDTFDLCGADHRSLSEFKEKFAQELVARHALERYRGPVSRGLMALFAAARRSGA
jgi:hypothetical protein